MINLSGNTLNQPAKFRSNNWVKIIDDAMERDIPIVKLTLKLHC